MRIIRGKYGRRRFNIPASFVARPTTDFAKENLFNVIENYLNLEGLNALDLFAGTGGISFELLSRGCSQVTSVEIYRDHVSFIRKVADQLKTNEINIFCVDVFKFLKFKNMKSFDLIFADPPYNLEKLTELPKLILEKGWLNVGGWFILEHSKKNDFSSEPYFYQQRSYGSVNFSFFFKEGEKINA